MTQAQELRNRATKLLEKEKLLVSRTKAMAQLKAAAWRKKADEAWQRAYEEADARAQYWHDRGNEMKEIVVMEREVAKATRKRVAWHAKADSLESELLAVAEIKASEWRDQAAKLFEQATQIDNANQPSTNVARRALF